MGGTQRHLEYTKIAGVRHGASMIMSNKGNVLLRRNAVGRASEPGHNSTTHDGQRQTLCSATRRDSVPPSAEPRDSCPKQNKSVGTGISTTSKRQIGCVTLIKWSNTRCTVESGIKRPVSKAGTPSRGEVSSLPRSNQRRVSCHAMDREEQQQQDSLAQRSGDSSALDVRSRFLGSGKSG